MAFTGHTLPFIPLFSLHVSNMIAFPQTEVCSLQISLVLSPSMDNQSKQASGGVGFCNETLPDAFGSSGQTHQKHPCSLTPHAEKPKGLLPVREAATFCVLCGYRHV